MPPASSSQQGPPPIVLPKPLPTWLVAVYMLMLPVCVGAFLVAFVGLFVLADKERTSWLANTTFAEKYRALMQWNQMTSTLCFNGGILGAGVSFAQLRRHRRAQLLKRVKFLRPEDIQKAQGGKQGKKRR